MRENVGNRVEDKHGFNQDKNSERALKTKAAPQEPALSEGHAGHVHKPRPLIFWMIL